MAGVLTFQVTIRGETETRTAAVTLSVEKITPNEVRGFIASIREGLWPKDDDDGDNKVEIRPDRTPSKSCVFSLN